MKSQKGADRIFTRPKSSPEVIIRAISWKANGTPEKRRSSAKLQNRWIEIKPTAMITQPSTLKK